MGDKNRKLLDQAIEQEILKLETLEPGSKERSDVVIAINQLYKLRIEEDKIEQENAASTREEVLKQAELRSRFFDRLANIGLQVGLTGLSLFAYNKWFNRGLKFNETGTITDPMTKGLLNRLLPSRK